MALDNRGARVLASDPATGLRLLEAPRTIPGDATPHMIFRLDGAVLPEHLISYDLGDRAAALKAYGTALAWLRSPKA